MKLICNRDILFSQIIHAKEFTISKSSLSIGSNVYLKTKQNSLEIKATDNNLGFITYVNVDTIEDGETTVDCEKLLEILKSFSGIEDIKIETKNDTMNIQPGQGSDKKVKFSLKTIPASEFPEMKNSEDFTFFPFNGSDFLDMVKQTSFAVSTDETRNYLCGLYLERFETGVNMVATDGKRLSLVERNMDENIPVFPSAIIPLRFINCLKKFIGEKTKLQLFIDEALIGALIDDEVFMYSSLVNGNFPKYRRIIPESQPNKCILNLSDTKAAINRVSIFVLDKSNKIYLKLTENKVEITSDITEMGTASEQLECDYSGEDCEIALNFQYLLNPLNTMDGDYFSLNFDSPKRAIKVIPETGTHDYFHIIMPIQQD